MSICFKNGTTGDLNPAIYGIKLKSLSCIFSNTKEGMVSIYKTSGNSDTHIILRGGTKPNLYPDDVRETIDALIEAQTNDSIMIDVSHGNSQKVFKRQLENISDVSNQISDGVNEIRGVMIESHLTEGNQKIGDDLEYGQSITDACINFEDTKQCLAELSSAVQARRSKS
jgi:phospho-2-dehydro-3-deoxyheptonate aldolase